MTACAMISYSGIGELLGMTMLRFRDIEKAVFAVLEARNKAMNR